MNINNNNQTHHSRLGGIFLIIGWVLALALVSLLVHKAMFSPQQPIVTTVGNSIEITLYRAPDAHFHIPGTINGIEVTFLIDTGATTIAISENIAKKAQLPKLAQMNTQTAGGSAIGYFTNIESVEISGVEFENLSAVIIPDMAGNKALLGMNLLQKFTITQDAKQMIISIPPAS